MLLWPTDRQTPQDPPLSSFLASLQTSRGGSLGTVWTTKDSRLKAPSSSPGKGPGPCQPEPGEACRAPLPLPTDGPPQRPGHYCRRSMEAAAGLWPRPLCLCRPSQRAFQWNPGGQEELLHILRVPSTGPAAGTVLGPIPGGLLLSP